jgi:2-phosphoglycerate kinase
MISDVNDILEHIAETAAAPTDAALLGPWKKGEAKAKSIILDGVKDQIIPHLTEKMLAKDMWAALSVLYQSKKENRVMVLRERMRSTKMAKGESVVQYLTRLTQIREEVATVGTKTEDFELVHVALNGFLKSRDTFVRGIVAREKLPGWC